MLYWQRIAMTGIPDDYFQEGVICQRSLLESSRLSREDLRAWACVPRHNSVYL